MVIDHTETFKLQAFKNEEDEITYVHRPTGFFNSNNKVVTQMVHFLANVFTTNSYSRSVIASGCSNTCMVF